MLVIHDKQLAKELEQIAEREKRPVEELLKSMVAQYPAGSSSVASNGDKSAMVKRVRVKLYTKARQYWQSVGDHAKAAMTDAELDESFGAFDEEGVPRLKDELLTSEPAPGSLAYAAMIAERGNFRSGNSDFAQQSDEILNAHFAEDYLKRIRGEDAER